MARVKLTEYRAKSLLVDDYDGVSLRVNSLDSDMKKLDAKSKYIIKVDQGVKKRGKQGLVRLNVLKTGVKKAVSELAERGYDRFIAEPMLAHDDSEERYLSLERVRGGLRILYSPKGGVDIEENPASIKQYSDPAKVPLPTDFMKKLTSIMDREHLSFLEINPLVVRGDKCNLLDAAVLADSAGASTGQLGWGDDDVADKRQLTNAEATIAELNDNSPASFSFRVLNPDGAIWLLLSGGGASITIADEAANRGQADLVGNYGEYSGGPTAEETQLYTEAVISQLLASKSSQKAIVIAGGVANFTDVKKTFAGVIVALDKNIDKLKKAKVRVFVRRGGPNEADGLAMMKKYLQSHELFGSVHGSGDVLTVVVDEALEYIHA